MNTYAADQNACWIETAPPGNLAVAWRYWKSAGNAAGVTGHTTAKLSAGG
jgi:hypothetical protein